MSATERGADPFLILDCGIDEEDGLFEHDFEAPRATLCDAGSLAVLDPGGGVGFHALPPLARAGSSSSRASRPRTCRRQRAERFFATLGRLTEWVGDAPGLVLGRIVCQLINEAAFALGEGVGTADDIDTGMVLGLNHPRGPLAWADAIGLDHVLAVLDGLCEEYREERYRPAPSLRPHALAGRLGRHVGAGFFSTTEGPSRLRRERFDGVHDRRPSFPFPQFLDAHREAVWGFLAASVGPVEADDCFQETWMSALKAYPRLGPARTCAPGCSPSPIARRSTPTGGAPGGGADRGCRGARRCGPPATRPRRGAVGGRARAPPAPARGDPAALRRRPLPRRDRAGRRRSEEATRSALHSGLDNFRKGVQP